MCQTLPFETTRGKEHKVWEQANLGLVRGRRHHLSTAHFVICLGGEAPRLGAGVPGGMSKVMRFFFRGLAL